MLETQYIDKKFDSVYEKLDALTEKVSALELKTCRRVDRNSFILNGLLWFIGLLIAGAITGGITILVRSMS